MMDKNSPFFVPQTSIDTNYKELSRVLKEAVYQAAIGKGFDRHATGEPFEDQIICEIQRRLGGVGIGFALGQAIKKTIESTRLSTVEAAKAELLGAINYLAAAVIHLERKEKVPPKDHES